MTQTATMTVLGPALAQMLSGLLPAVSTANFSAHLLAPSTQFETGFLTSLSDVSDYLVGHQIPFVAPIHGARVELDLEGAPCFHTDALVFGDPVSTPPFRYIGFAYGLPDAPLSEKSLLGYLDLAPTTGAVEVVNGPLHVQPPAEGWFNISPTG